MADIVDGELSISSAGLLAARTRPKVKVKLRRVRTPCRASRSPKEPTPRSTPPGRHRRPPCRHLSRSRRRRGTRTGPASALLRHARRLAVPTGWPRTSRPRLHTCVPLRLRGRSGSRFLDKYVPIVDQKTGQPPTGRARTLVEKKRSTSVVHGNLTGPQRHLSAGQSHEDAQPRVTVSPNSRAVETPERCACKRHERAGHERCTVKYVELRTL